jgi:hypothetical protein
MDLAQEEEPVINRGPNEDNIDLYLESVDKIKGALVELTKIKFKNADKALSNLRALYKKAVQKIEGLLRTSLSIQSALSDPLVLVKQNGRDAVLGLMQRVFLSCRTKQSESLNV